ncbi:hypothetical protein M378DRAFT_182236 [Amanita muscaria Koide BX008]|uniref:Uncharacterized protein n=1 Tax=Amanita muscaria (strain Koide BX008) TaxID=946122 RepID=A0A0C2W2X2_AMAMK|nr:hypothetical protein M378DRAFT_182236 [Amanita muscaria Koide BX008]
MSEVENDPFPGTDAVILSASELGRASRTYMFTRLIVVPPYRVSALKLHNRRKPASEVHDAMAQSYRRLFGSSWATLRMSFLFGFAMHSSPLFLCYVQAFNVFFSTLPSSLENRSKQRDWGMALSNQP